MAVERIVPMGRQNWLALRAQDITASQVGALFGEHEFLSAYGVWAVKTGLRPDTFDETPAMKRGRLLEPVAIQLLQEDYPTWRIEHNSAANIYYRDPEHRLGATPDVIVHAPDRGKGVVQVKSVEASVFRRKWHDSEGIIDPPAWICLQAILEAHLVGARWAAIAPIVVGYGVEMPLVEVPIVPGVVDAIRAKVADFWQMVAEGREPTPDYAKDGELISALYGDGDPDHEIDLSKDNRIQILLEARRAAEVGLADAKRLTKLIDEIDAEVRAKMGRAHVAHIGQGKRITWKPTKRDGYFVAPATIRPLRYPTLKD